MVITLPLLLEMAILSEEGHVIQPERDLGMRPSRTESGHTHPQPRGRPQVSNTLQVPRSKIRHIGTHLPPLLLLLLLARARCRRVSLKQFLAVASSHAEMVEEGESILGGQLGGGQNFRGPVGIFQ